MAERKTNNESHSGKSLRRLALSSLLDWKNKLERKPMIVYGVRQCGKSHLVCKQLASYFTASHVFDCRAQGIEILTLFTQDYNTERILRGLSIIAGKNININKDLIVFDEVQECLEVIESLKYFCERYPNAYIVALGSLLRNKVAGLTRDINTQETRKAENFSFPVGKVEQCYLYPMNFYEFLLASGKGPLIEAYEANRLDSLTHQYLIKYYLDYLFVGGMPEAVRTWYQLQNLTNKQANQNNAVTTEFNEAERVEAVRIIHEQLLAAYRGDFLAKENVVDGSHIKAVFSATYRHIGLQQINDGSLDRFKFKGVIPRKSRYEQIRSPIEWLVAAGLLHKVYPIDSEPNHSAYALIKENQFKLVPHDIGLLNAELKQDYLDITLNRQGLLKGILAEIFVHNELRSSQNPTRSPSPLLSWRHPKGSYEIEFIMKDPLLGVYPIEVKAGEIKGLKSGSKLLAKAKESLAETHSSQKSFTKACKSLNWYIEHFKPRKALLLSASAPGLGLSVEETSGDGDHHYLHLPLYYAGVSREIMSGSMVK